MLVAGQSVWHDGPHEWWVTAAHEAVPVNLRMAKLRCSCGGKVSTQIVVNHYGAPRRRMLAGVNAGRLCYCREALLMPTQLCHCWCWHDGLIILCRAGGIIAVRQRRGRIKCGGGVRVMVSGSWLR